MAKQLNMPYYEVSAKTAQNIEKFFDEAIDIIQECSTEATSHNDQKETGNTEEKLREPKKVAVMERPTPSYRRRGCCEIWLFLFFQ